MPSLPFTSRHPYLTTITTTVALVMSLGIAGTALYLSGHTTVSPVAVVFPLILLGVVVRALIHRRLPRPLWSGAHAVPRSDYLLAVTVPVGILALTAFSVGGYPTLPASDILWFLVFALLIGLVEELIYRGWFLSLLLPRGRMVAVLVSSALFAASHAVNALAGQDVATSIRQIIFAFLFGIVAALLYLLLGNLWVAIGFHALNDLIQFLGARSTSPTIDIATTGMLVAAIGVLLALLRRSDGTTPAREIDSSDPERNAIPRRESASVVTFGK